METFIVRFYRRELRPPRDVAGTVECVRSGERVGFTGEMELLARLLEAERVAASSASAQADAPVPSTSGRTAP